jgi:hypothetical protein
MQYMLQIKGKIGATMLEVKPQSLANADTPGRAARTHTPDISVARIANPRSSPSKLVKSTRQPPPRLKPPAQT